MDLTFPCKEINDRNWDFQNLSNQCSRLEDTSYKLELLKATPYNPSISLENNKAPESALPALTNKPFYLVDIVAG